jgi:hypothetical protein
VGDAREPDGSGHLLAIGVLEVPDGTAVNLSVYTVAEISVSRAGRPVLPRMDLAAQRRRTMSRCQRSMVSGVIKISVIRHVSWRRDSCSHEAVRVIRRRTNRRHMTGDHHGHTAGMATLLVRALDGLLGTHSLKGARLARDCSSPV